MTQKFTSVDEYIAMFSLTTQRKLQTIRKAIRDAAPGAEEVISYNMPAYRLIGILVYFAGYERHIGFYPTASGIAHFARELSGYKSAKGSVQFPLAEPVPVELVQEIVRFRVRENALKEGKRKSA